MANQGAAGPRHRTRRRPLLVALLAVLALALVGGVTAIALHERNQYKAPGADAVALPAGVRVAQQVESCGSGGCPDRALVLVSSASDTQEELMTTTSTALEGDGWKQSRSENNSIEFRKDDLVVELEPLDASWWGWPQVQSKGALSGAQESSAVIATLSYDDFGVGRFS